MTATTSLVTLMNGAKVEVKGDRETVHAMFKAHSMCQLTTTDGEFMTVNAAFVGLIEAAKTVTKQKLGFA